ncbi:MAG: hypothetical protein FLDDKLPJ_03542 [Phycisphaerae bacterium]|nr:hypothetical protein [Phycisphaerae bacterium]
MIHETIPGFDCLDFKRKVQAELYEATRHLSRADRLAYFRRRAENGPFADLLHLEQRDIATADRRITRIDPGA